MNRHEQREKAMITVYQYLLAKRDIHELMEDTYGCRVDEIDPYFVKVIETATANEERYASYINEVLKGWKYDRLGMIERAILLDGCAEFDLKENTENVIIDESVQMAKKYCEPDAYKLINRVLDII
jgi:N utilization substance protein B